MTPQVLRARFTLPVVCVVVAAGVAALGWLSPSAYEVKLVGHWKRMLPLLPVVAGLIVGAWCSTRPRLIVDADGVRMRRLIGWVALRWDDIDRYRYMVMTPDLGKAPAMAAMNAARVAGAPNRNLEIARVWLEARDGGRRIGFGPGLFFDRRRVAAVVDDLLGELHRRLRARPDLSFAPLQIRDGELVCPGMPALPLARITRVVVADRPSVVQVFHDAAMFKGAAGDRPYVEMKMAEVSNLWLLVEALRAGGVVVDIAPAVFVPRGVAES